MSVSEYERNGYHGPVRRSILLSLYSSVSIYFEIFVLLYCLHDVTIIPQITVLSPTIIGIAAPKRFRVLVFTQ